MDRQNKNQLILEQAIGFNVNRTAYLMSEEIGRRFRAHGYPLSAQDFGILHLLWKNKDLTQMEIAARMMRNKTTITRRLNGLENKGLLYRSPSPRDRRYFFINLTDKCNTAVSALSPLVAEFQQEVSSDISDEDKTITLNTLKKIIAKLS